LPPEPFFSGPGIWRADLLRAQPDRLAELAVRADARELQWADGLPLLEADGRLAWGPVRNPLLFLGLDGDAPRFSALPPSPPPAVAFGLLAQLETEDAPKFACALSLANWHGRHGHCSVCGQPTELVRGGWSRRCPACGGEHFPRLRCAPLQLPLAVHREDIAAGGIERSTLTLGIARIAQMHANACQQLHGDDGLGHVIDATGREP
jgi:NAD+ diphosphatase